MIRGEVWWAELAGEAGFRPVVIVSGDERSRQRLNVTVAEVTRVVRSLPCEVPLSPDDGMSVECVINTDNLHTVPKDCLRERVIQLSPEKLFQLDQALRDSLNLV